MAESAHVRGLRLPDWKAIARTGWSRSGRATPVEALVEADDLDHVLGVHGGSVVARADGYARATERPAFAGPHVAAGPVNGVIGLLNASRSRTPLVVVADQQDRRHLVQDPMLSGDLAVQPPAGLVFLSIPADLPTADVDVIARSSPRTAPLLVDVPITGHSRGAA